KMADEDVPALAPTRSDDQILPFAAWVPIGKSNYNTNFFRAFTASASVPAIYIQQFWNTLTYEAKTIVHIIELDESRFVLDANLLRMAVNNLSQPWRAILSMINQCLTGKNSGHDRLRYPVL
ncbi:hypothetical protein Tco_1564947, partial [Tanacetum coccineum]